MRHCFRGCQPTVLLAGNVAWFGVYELMASKFRDEDGHVAPVGSIVAGASAGVAYWTVPFPADTVDSDFCVQKLSVVCLGQDKNTDY